VHARPGFLLSIVALLTLLALPGGAAAQVTAEPAVPSAAPAQPASPSAESALPVPSAQPAGTDAQVPDAAQVAKLAELEGLLAEDERMTRRWWRFWSLVQAALIVGQVSFGYFVIDDRDERAAFYLNAGASGIGLLSLLVTRPPALKATKRVLSLPSDTPEQRALKLRAAEELVEESGKAQAFNTGWAPYTGGAVVGLAVALPLWIKFDRKVDSVLALVGSMAFTTVQTLTTPVRARDYRRRQPVQVSLGVSLGGLSINGAF
jgi:hypothetical protein